MPCVQVHACAGPPLIEPHACSQLLKTFSNRLSLKALLITFFPTRPLPEFNYSRRPTDWLDVLSFHFSV